MAQQTAVDLIISQLKKQKKILTNHFVAGKWTDDRVSEIDKCILVCENAKQIEKEQITTAYQADRRPCSDQDGEQYYNETYGTANGS